MTLINLFSYMWYSQHIAVYIDGEFRYRGTIRDFKSVSYNERVVRCIRASESLPGVIEILI